jgi:DNA-binding CsgD family transcriptional regulator
MNMQTKLHLNLEDVFRFKGLAHIYMTDLNHVLLDCNDLQAKILKEVLKVSKEDCLGLSLAEIFKDNWHVEKILADENEFVMKNKCSKQFYNAWFVDNQHTIELLTIKMPTYDSQGNMSGVFGISQYVNKFSPLKALALGLSSKETEILCHLLEGKSTTQMADILNISLSAAENHLDQMQNKLGCASQAALIIKALKTKLPRKTFKQWNLSSEQIPLDTSFQLSSKSLPVEHELVDSNLSTLSKKESACLYHLSQGLTLKRIAKQMGISPKTVETYIERAKIKTHCQNKAQLISAFMRLSIA